MELEDRLRHLIGLATNPVAVVVAPDALADPQAFADETGVAVRVSGTCVPNRSFLQAASERPIGDVVATPRSA